MDRTPLGDLEEALALLPVERPAETHNALDVLDPAGLVAVAGVDRMNAVIRQVNRDMLEWPSLAVGVEPKRHRGAWSRLEALERD